MRYLLTAFTFVAVLCGNVSAQAEKRTFIIANNSDGYGVDRCLASGAACGKAVATAYCKAREFAQGGLLPQGRPRGDHRRDSDQQPLLPRRRLRSIRRHRVHALGLCHIAPLHLSRRCTRSGLRPCFASA